MYSFLPFLLGKHLYSKLTLLYFQGTFGKFDPWRTKMYLHCHFISESACVHPEDVSYLVNLSVWSLSVLWLVSECVVTDLSECVLVVFSECVVAVLWVCCGCSLLMLWLVSLRMLWPVSLVCVVAALLVCCGWSLSVFWLLSECVVAALWVFWCCSLR